MKFDNQGPLALPLWINGRALMVMAERFYEVADPATGTALRRVPLCGAEEVAEALAAARTAQPAWADMGLMARRVCLGRLADALAHYAEHFATLLAETGERDPAGEVAAAAAALRESPVGQTGVAGLVVDARQPLANACRAAAPALLAGAALVIKPSPQAPSALFALAELTARCDWPGGVLNLVHGDSAAVDALCGAADRVIYAGGPELGHRVAERAQAAGVPFEAR